MRRTLLALGIFALVLAFCSYGSAAEVTVSDESEFQTALDTAQSNGEDDTIILNAGTYIIPAFPFTYDALLPGEGSLTLVASGDVILDGQNADQVLNIDNYNGTDVTLDGLTVQNGNSTDSCGGAYVETGWGDLTVKNCNFNNNVTYANGGGLYAIIEQNAILTLENNQFNSNTASDDLSGSEYGGGAYLEVEYGEISVTGNKFQGNSATDYAGALYVDVDSVGDIELTSNEFTGNHADNYYGGAVYLYISDTGDMILEGNLFEDNTASYGSALYAYVSEVGNIFMTGDTFRNNEAGNYGAAYLEVYYSGVMKVDSCDFTGNKALNSCAGALYTYSDYGADIMIINSTFSGNMADDEGGGLYAYVSEEGAVLIQNSTFDANVSSNDYGGGAYVEGYYGNVYVADSTFTNNRADGSGGGIHAEPGYGNLWVSNNVFDGNIAASYGGGAYFEIYDYGDLTIESNTFTNNSAENGGGLYAYPYDGDFVFRNNVIANNTSSYEGGGIYVDSGYVRYGDITNNTITGNVVSEDTYYGGGIYLYADDDGEIFSLYNNIIRGNSASAGDDVYLDDNKYDVYFYLYNNNFSILSQDITGTESMFLADANVNFDPMFVSSTDFHLQAGSPLIDLGDSLAPSLPEIDRDGNARVYGDNVDMGAYEYGSGSIDDSDIDDTATTTSGSSGGCNTAAFVPSMLLFLAPLFIFARKR